MPRASTLFWCLRPMYWILLTKHRMPCWIHGWIWPLNPEPHRRYPCASCITLTSLLRAFSSPLKRGWESNSLLRQNRSNAEQRWELEAEHCVWKAWEHVCPTSYCSFLSSFTKIAVVGKGLPRGQKVVQGVSSQHPSLPHNPYPSSVFERIVVQVQCHHL